MSLSGAVRRIGIFSTSDRLITSQAHYQLFKVSQYLRGWINYVGIATGYQRCCDLDHWIRRRVRMAYLRQWRKPRTKVRNLMKLGVHVQAALACGITSKGPWRSSKTPGIQQALSNDYLKAEGLASLRDGWIKASPFPVKRPVRSRRSDASVQGVVGAGG